MVNSGLVKLLGMGLRKPCKTQAARGEDAMEASELTGGQFRPGQAIGTGTMEAPELTGGQFWPGQAIGNGTAEAL